VWHGTGHSVSGLSQSHSNGRRRVVSRQLVRSSIANLLGAVLPALVTLATIPFIVSRLGEVNYGVLTMVTAIVGYFALIDINVTSASVKYVAQYRAMSQLSELYQVVTFGA